MFSFFPKMFQHALVSLLFNTNLSGQKWIFTGTRGSPTLPNSCLALHFRTRQATFAGQDWGKCEGRVLGS